MGKWKLAIGKMENAAGELNGMSESERVPTYQCRLTFPGLLYCLSVSQISRIPKPVIHHVASRRYLRVVRDHQIKFRAVLDDGSIPDANAMAKADLSGGRSPAQHRANNDGRGDAAVLFYLHISVDLAVDPDAGAIPDLHGAQ